MHKERKFSLSCYRFWHSCPSDLHPNNLQGYSENLNRYGFSWSWRSYCFFEKSAHCALFSGHTRPRTAAPTYSAGFPVGRTNVNPENHATGRRPAGSRQSHAVHAGASENSAKGLSAASRARKVATLRSFFNYLCNKVHLLPENPIRDIDSPKIKKSLPHYLTLDESIQLLENVDGPNRERDLCILTFFLNCGLRISELIGLNRSDIQDDALRVLGKGNKVRIVYLNEACKDALDAYLKVRPVIGGKDQDALFVSRNHQRISRATVHNLVKKHLAEAGLDSQMYSAHKLRHTAATLMLQNGVDVKAVQEVLGHEHLNTTEIYTHIDNESLRIAAKANPLSHVKIKGKIED